MQKLICKRNISIEEKFPDISAADLPVFVICFLDHINCIAIFRCIFLQHLMIASFFMTKIKVRSHNNVCCVQLLMQDLFDKFLCFHLHQLFCEWNLDQIIYLVLKKCPSLFICHQTISVHIKCTNDTVAVFLLRIFHYSVEQLLMSSVQSVKLSKRYRCLISSVKGI